MASSTVFVQIACLAVLVCAFASGAFAGYCRFTIDNYTDENCNQYESGLPGLWAEDNVCTAFELGVTKISTFANCTSLELTLYASANCDASGESVFLRSGECTLSRMDGEDDYLRITFGGSSSTLTSWISLLTALLF